MSRITKLASSWTLLLILAAPVLAQDKKPEGQPGDDEMAAMMDVFMKYATPGKHHDHLKTLAGKWKTSMRFRMSPDAPWNESTGECESEWILGGRFLQSKVKSPPSEAIPYPFEGFGLLGYDNLAKGYISVWTDTFLTGVMVFTGSCDASGKVITLAGEFADPRKGGAMSKERWVYRIINENKFIFEMWSPGEDGKEFRHGEITYTRVK
ncbi:MAG: DUF1579 domain-containing protein [Planctomycetes bacterium]|nr:DUF1579 domain-containing protein [Planctomycetota bacterium]